MGRNVPYEPHRRTALEPNEVAAFTVRIMRSSSGEIDALDASGRCPTCEHVTSQPVAISIADGPIPAVEGDGGGDDDESDEEIKGELTEGLLRVRRIRVANEGILPQTRPIVMTCLCASEHEGAAAFGCGASWMLRVTFTPDGEEETAVVSPPTNKDLQLWWQVAEQQRGAKGALAAVRSSASLWQKALAGLFTLVSLPAVVAGRDVMVKLQPDDVTSITGWVILALAATALATYWAHKASIGQPKVVTLFSRTDITKATGGELPAARAAAGTLHSAFIATAVALGSSFVALAVLWNADEKPATAKPAGVVVVTTPEDEQVCGELLNSDDDGIIRLRPPTDSGVAEPVNIPLTEVASIAAPESCP